VATAQDTYARRVEREIAVFEGQEALHNHGPAFHHYTAAVVRPLIELAFGRHGVHEVYAESIAGAVARSGLDRVYSLGCGDGAQEREVLRAADRLGLPPFRIAGLELAPAVAARANAVAEAEGLAGRFEVIVHDLNWGLPGEGDVAAVMAHHVLHHIVALEELFDFVAERLHPDGVFVTFDMIGRNGHMRWPEMRPLVRRLWSMLPSAQRRDHVFGTPSLHFQDWDCAIEGFEGVRAQDILPLMAERFTIGRFAAWGGLADTFVNPRAAPNFDPRRAEDRAFLDAVSALEVALLDARRTTPASMVAEFRSRRGSFTADAATEARLRAALRAPDEVFAPVTDPGFASPYPPQGEAPRPVLEPDSRSMPILGAPAHAALHEGWVEAGDNGAYALLDEQVIRFRTAVPVSEVALYAWNPLPTDRAQALRADCAGCAPAITGPLEYGAQVTMRLAAVTPRVEWEVRVSAAAYRLPDQDGGPDRRPLAWLLTEIEVGSATTLLRGLMDRLRQRLRLQT
jgi:SAM-dependent methyltransferase